MKNVGDKFSTKTLPTCIAHTPCLIICDENIYGGEEFEGGSGDSLVAWILVAYTFSVDLQLELQLF